MQSVELFTLSKDPSVLARELKRIINAGNTIVAFNVDYSGHNFNYLTVVAERSATDARFKGLSAGGR